MENPSSRVDTRHLATPRDSGSFGNPMFNGANKMKPEQPKGGEERRSGPGTGVSAVGESVANTMQCLVVRLTATDQRCSTPSRGVLGFVLAATVYG